MGRVHSQVDGKVRNSLIRSCHPICFILNLFSDGNKVHKLFPFTMQKFSIFRWTIDQLENQRTTGHNSTTTGQEISVK